MCSCLAQRQEALFLWALAVVGIRPGVALVPAGGVSVASGRRLCRFLTQTRPAFAICRSMGLDARDVSRMIELKRFGFTHYLKFGGPFGLS